MDQLDVRASKLPLVLVILLGIFFVPIGLTLIGGPGFGLRAIGLMCLIAFGIVVWLARRGHRRSVRRFSDEGLVRNDGQSFAWADLDAVVNKLRVRPYGRKSLWRTEIHFKQGQ